MFTLRDVLEATSGRLLSGAPTLELRSVVIDSRLATPGSLFVAFRGELQDGHDFVTDAFARGAAAALVTRTLPDQPWGAPNWTMAAVVQVPDALAALQALAHSWRQRHHATVIGVTGSVGKTTTKEVIASVLAHDRPVLRSRANLNTEYGLPICLMDLDRSHRAVVLEMGMHSLGDIRLLAEVAEPEIGVVTNVQPVHLEGLGTIERIADAKAELVESLPRSGLAVLNADDPRVAAMAERTRADTVTYGLSPRADIWADEILSEGFAGVSFTVHHGDEQARVQTPLLGAHSVYAALAAVAVATRGGVPFTVAVARLSAIEQQLRQVVVPGIAGATIMDDSYNASPGSMLAALDLLAQTPGRHVAVLADMLELGSYEAEGHAAVGRRAAAVTDWLVTVGSRARGIAAAAKEQERQPGAVDVLDQDDQVVALLRAGLRAGDVVLVKGSHSMHLDKVVSALRAVD